MTMPNSFLPLEIKTTDYHHESHISQLCIPLFSVIHLLFLHTLRILPISSQFSSRATCFRFSCRALLLNSHLFQFYAILQTFPSTAPISKGDDFPRPHWKHYMDRLSITPLPMAAAKAITGEISGFINNSLSFMPTNCLIPFPTDPGFTERAARYSSFTSGDYGEAKVGILETGKLSRVSSCQSLKSKENSSVTDIGSRPGENNARKRKTVPKSKAKVSEESNLNVKKNRSAETGDEKVGFEFKEVHNAEEKQGKDNSSEPPEPPKGYIHVRARRGQATDSHSLAERVRREKISQRMKVLQDLVPGCNKITGKALMLDEIINYVQSLQRQVEFLSMKLATMNPRLDCNLVNLVAKEPLMSQTNASLPSSVHAFSNLASAFPCIFQSKGVTKGMETQSSLSQLNYNFYQSPYLQPASIDVLGGSSSQLGNLWDDDLHSIVQMSPVQNQDSGFNSRNFHAGRSATINMKAEL